MKSFAFLSTIAIAQQGNKNEYCSAEIGSDEAKDPEACGSDRSFARARNFIEVMNCPDGELSANPNCAGYTLRNGRTLSYRQALNQALDNYGCNCFSNNHKIPNINGGAGFHAIPGNNGEPVDDLDAFCKILARRHKCMNFDYGPNSGLEFAHGNPNRQKCDYLVGYAYEHDTATGEFTCGPANNPGYANNGPWYQRPENQKHFNMNQCRLAICEMDLEFAQSVAPLLTDPWAFRQANRNNKNISDTNACEAPGVQGNVDTCCGPKSERNPFNSSIKRCCAEQIVDIGSSDESQFC